MSFDHDQIVIPEDGQPRFAVRTKVTRRREDLSTIPPKSHEGPSAKAHKPEINVRQIASLTSVADSIKLRDMVMFLKQLNFMYAPYTLRRVKESEDMSLEDVPNKFGHSADGPFMSAEDFVHEQAGSSVYVQSPDGDVYVVPSTLHSNAMLPVGFVVAILEWKQQQA
jgi:hypothetical protein